jgi:hypothetical protein
MEGQKAIDIGKYLVWSLDCFGNFRERFASIKTHEDKNV